MSTNYYLITKGTCDHCGTRGVDKKLHIGLSSVGWCFQLHIMPEIGVNDLDDWFKLFAVEGNRIVDEYGRTLHVVEMIHTIAGRWHAERRTDFDYDANYAVPGPNNLVRSKVGDHCVRHGAGTWDLVPGEFS